MLHNLTTGEEEEERGREDVGGVALSAASRRKIRERKMGGENGGWDTEGKLRRRRATESEWKVREDRKKGRTGGDECAAISS